MTLRVVELFAGIGAQAMALEELGIPFTSIVCENDQKAYASYCAIHGETPNLGDITKVERIPVADLVTWSFPCTDLSIASGTQKGFAEGSGTRSSLAWEAVRLLKVGKAEGTLPEFLLMENVPAILNRRNLAEFKRLVKELKGIGYTSTYQVLNAKDYGVPQNRKRCFMVSTLTHGRFVFPEPCPDGRVLKDILQPSGEIPEKLWLSEEIIARYDEHWKNRQEAPSGAVECADGQDGASGHPTMRWPAATRKGYMDARDGDGIVMARPTRGRGTVQPQQSPTVTCGNTTGVCLMDTEEGDVCATTIPGNMLKGKGHGLRIRYLSSLEAWRLQGFPDAAYYAAKAVPTSDAQLYKQAGNSIAVPCLKAIFKGMLTDGTWTDAPEKGDGE